jgi:hypothetical protein
MPAIRVDDPREIAGTATENGFGVPDQPLAKQSAPPLIQKKPKESMAAFYIRAETSGVGRQCLSCGGKRRYSMVQCPYCFQYAMEEIRLKPQMPDPAALPPEPYATGMDEAVLQGKAGVGGFSYVPKTGEETDPTKVFAAGVDVPGSAAAEEEDTDEQGNAAVNASPANNLGGVPLSQRSLAELQEFAAVHQIDLGPSKRQTKNSVLKAIEGKFGVQPAAKNALPALEPVKLDETDVNSQDLGQIGPQ